jgi:hypothetical protein
VGKTHRWVDDRKGASLQIELMGRRRTLSEAERKVQQQRAA